MSIPVTRPTLLIALRDPANDTAWQEFVHLYTPLIFGYCARRTPQEADAADVTQEVLKTVVRAIQQFEYDPQRGTFRSWLFRVTRSKLNNFLAARLREPQPGSESTADALLAEIPTEEEANSWDNEFRQRLFDCAAAELRDEFESRTWDAFWRTAVAGEPVAQVAVSLSMSAGAVYIARSRITARFHARVAELISDEENLGPLLLRGDG